MAQDLSAWHLITKIILRQIGTYLVSFLILFGVGSVFCLPAVAQESAEEQSVQTSSAIASATDYSIPSAPAYAFLDASPSAVHTPHFPRDFRVDWLIQGNQLASNLAIEAAPVWLFGFGNVSASEYRKKSWAMQSLSTLNVSAATVGEGQNRSLSIAGKLTLYQESNPVADTSYTNQLSRTLGFSEAQTRAQDTIDNVVFRAFKDTTLTEAQRQAIDRLADQATQFGEFDPSSVSAYRSLSKENKRELEPRVQKLREAHQTMKDVSEMTAQRLRSIKKQYEREHWNDTRVDLAGGRVYGFTTSASVQQLDSLSLDSAGWGAWVNGATGFGTEDWLFSGLARAIDRGEAETYFVGGNLRYGGGDANFFVETGYRWGDRPVETLVSYGGSISISPKLNVQFGLRNSFNGDLELQGLSPKIKLNGKASELLNAIPL